MGSTAWGELPSRAGIASFESRWQRSFFFLAAVLASTVLLKFAQVQYLEYLYLGLLLLLARGFVVRDFKAVLFRPFLRIGLWYALFIVAVMALAVAALRDDFYLPSNLPLLKGPVWTTFSRDTELLLSVVAMLYMASQFRAHSGWLVYTMRVYFWTGVATAVYSILSYPLNVAHIIDLGAYLDSHRLRGFYNEGGPYGTYIVSVCLVGITLYTERWEPRGRLRIAALVLLIALTGSQSKAAIMTIFAVVFVNLLLIRGATARISLLLGSAVVLGVLLLNLNLSDQLRVYVTGSQDYERASRMHSTDGNFVNGKVAGAFIVPRMIVAHPLSGIGWGNYGLVRNDPLYRGGSSWTDINDDPGLGILGTAAELGLPLLALILFCLALPYLYVRRLRCPVHIQNLALIQPVAHLFGAQLNLTYPWIVSAFALGLACLPQPEPRLDAPRPESAAS